LVTDGVCFAKASIILDQYEDFEDLRWFRFRQARNLLAVCFRNLWFCLVSRPVRQALALDTLKSRRRPFPVSKTEFGAVIVPELKLVQVALQMLFAAKAVSALH